MIQILMSTYNGEKYLEEQLESLLNQSYQNIKILIRDDGSKDGTLEILDKYLKKYPQKIKCILGENKGVIGSFLSLIDASDKNCNYFAFCDQDDVWLKEKIEMAVNNMKTDIPFMYFSNKIIVDEKLNVLKKEADQPEITLGNSIIQNIATGCTIVINKKLLNVIKNRKIDTSRILMHDALIYIVANLIGEIYFDQNAYIYYRQHSNNVIGSETNLIKKYYKRIKKFKKRKKNALREQIEEILEIVKDKIDNEKRKNILEIINAKNFIQRYRILKKKTFKRQNKQDDVIFKILYLFGWF